MHLAAQRESECVVTEPNRDLALEIEDVKPPELTAESVASTPEAPYGYKDDGTPRIRRPKGYRSLPGWENSEPAKGGSRGRTPRRGGSGSLETQVGAFLFTVNAPFAMFLPSDALDPVEIQALAKAIDQECQRNATFRKYVVQMLAVQGGTSLLLVVAAIAGRRVIRHNLIEIPAPVGNDGADAALGGIISVISGAGAVNPNLYTMPKAAAETTETASA